MCGASEWDSEPQFEWFSMEQSADGLPQRSGTVVSGQEVYNTTTSTRAQRANNLSSVIGIRIHVSITIREFNAC